MKKLISILLLITMCVSMLTFVSCGDTPPAGGGGGKKPPSEPVKYAIPEGGYDGSEVTITFSHTMGESLRNVLDAYIAKFNEIYPNITVEHSQVGGYDEVRDQIKTELTAGNQPNIAYCYPDHVALYNVAKAVVPLNSFIDSKIEMADGSILGLTQEQIDDFIPGFYAEGAVYDTAGTMYTLPMSKSTEVLYYNKTFFDANGLVPPTNWDEMEDLCKRILEIDPDCWPFGYDSEANWFITMCEQLETPYTSNVTGKNFLFNTEENQAFVERLRGWYDKGYFTTQELYGSYTSNLFKELNDKNCYMCIGSSGGASHQVPEKVDNAYAFEVGVAPIPQYNAENPKVISQGPSLCILDNENKQEVVASWLFVKFLTTSSQFQAAFAMTSGYMPVIKSVETIDAYNNFIAKADGGANLIATVIKAGMEQSNAYFVSPAFNGSSVARDQVGKLMKYCFVQQTDDIKKMIADAFLETVKACYANM